MWRVLDLFNAEFETFDCCAGEGGYQVDAGLELDRLGGEPYGPKDPD